jgi:hypothetical protein
MSKSAATLLDKPKEPMGTFNLDEYQLTVGDIPHNLPSSSLYEHAIRYEAGVSSEIKAASPA